MAVEFEAKMEIERLGGDGWMDDGKEDT